MLSLATFTFDDSNSDIDLIDELFASYGVPACYATIPDKLERRCTHGETVREVLLRAQERGCEILAHCGYPLISTDPPEEYTTVYSGGRHALEDCGFTVNGFITAGGRKDGLDYSTQDFRRSITAAQEAGYCYADLTATGYADEYPAYYNRRQFLDLGAADTQRYIDRFLAGDLQKRSCWLNFASHGTNTNPLSVFAADIEYCLAHGFSIVTWATVFAKRSIF